MKCFGKIWEKKIKERIKEIIGVKGRGRDELNKEGERNGYVVQENLFSGELENNVGEEARLP